MSDANQTIWVPPRLERELLTRAAARAAGAGDIIEGPDGVKYMVVPHTEDLAKSVAESRAKGQPYRLNPSLWGMGSYQGIKEASGALFQTYNILRQIPARIPLIASIIRRRQNQVAGNYARVPRFKGDTGIRVAMRDQTRAPSSAGVARIKEIEDILFRGGIPSKNPRTGQVAVWNAECSERAMGLANAMKALVWDSLVLDAAAIEIQEGMNSSKYPVAFWNPTDGALIRYAVSKDAGKHSVDNFGGTYQNAYRPTIRPELRDVSFVAINPNGQGIEKEYAWNELGYLVRNPRTDSWVQGYGWSELEMLIDIASGILYGVRYNTEFFDSNRIPAGLLSLVGNFTDAALQDIRAQFKMMVSGPGQYWTMPIVAASPGAPGGGATYVPLRQDPADGMYWKEWILFCGTIACALYQMDSSEINMVNFGTSSNALGNSNPEARIEAAQESGLEALLGNLLPLLNDNIVTRIDPDFVAQWSGLSEQDLDQEIEQSTYRLTMGLSTPNRELALLDQRPIHDPLDQDLWLKCHRAATGDAENPEDKPAIEDETIARYRKAGGQFAQWPDAPVGNPTACAIWQQEHGLGQPAPGDGQEEEEQPQGTMEGEDTHIGDLGAAMLRRGRPPQPKPAQKPGQPANRPSGAVMPPKRPQPFQGGAGRKSGPSPSPAALRKGVVEILVRRREE